VTFHYKTHPDGPLHYGLIAEEVEQVMPELVVKDATGRPETVAYHELPAMLLNELQKQRATIQTQHTEIEALEAQLAERIEAHRSQIATLKDQVEQLARKIAALDGKAVERR
jgi:ABC-type Fe2+-enterobactin transport system substrate-binding protein